MRKRHIFAVIDIGSLSTGMKVFSVGEDGVPQQVEHLRSYLPLGSSTYSTGEISSDDLQELCRLLTDFNEVCRTYKVEKKFCVATSAFREAKNKFFAVDRIRLLTGLPVTILDNSMERYYRNIAAKELLPDFSRMAADGTVVLDIGSGSIQSTIYANNDFVFSQNMLLGPLRIDEMYSGLEAEAVDPQAVLEEHISTVLEDYHAIAPKGVQYKHLVVFGEETIFLKKLAGLDPDEDREMDFPTFEKLHHLLEKTSTTELVLQYHIPSPAAGLLRPSTILIAKTLEYSSAQKLYMPNVSLYEGVAYHYAWQNHEMLLKTDPEADILSAVRYMGKRYRFDKKHAERVRLFAVEIFDKTIPYHRLGKRERLLLSVASYCNEVGKHIQVSNYHLRSYHIIDTAELWGLDHKEQQIVADAVLYGGRGHLPDPHDRATEENDSVALKLAAILRLADALEASRKQKITQMRAVLERDTLYLYCEHQSDISYENWEVDNKKGFFIDVFGITPVMKPKRST